MCRHMGGGAYGGSSIAPPWTWNVVNDRVWATANMAQLFNRNPEGRNGGGLDSLMQQFSRSVHVGDRTCRASSK